MRIPLPFPRCPKCKNSWEQCVHKTCGGKLEFDAKTERVYCKRCCDSWNLWDSEYHCLCGNVFTPKEVKKAILTMLDMCSSVLDELERRDKAIRERKRIGEKSFKEFLYSITKSLGTLAGIVVETILNFFK